MSQVTTPLAPHERMNRARLFAGIDQTQMAAILGKSRNTISAWERGVNEPSVTDVAAWAYITGRTIDWIVWGDVRPERLELPTFWIGAQPATTNSGPFWTASRNATLAALDQQFDALMLTNQPNGSKA